MVLGLRGVQVAVAPRHSPSPRTYRRSQAPVALAPRPGRSSCLTRRRLTRLQKVAVAPRLRRRSRRRAQLCQGPPGPRRWIRRTRLPSLRCMLLRRLRRSRMVAVAPRPCRRPRRRVRPLLTGRPRRLLAPVAGYAHSGCRRRHPVALRPRHRGLGHRRRLRMLPQVAIAPRRALSRCCRGA